MDHLTAAGHGVAGLARLFRFALHLLVEDPGFAAVLAAPSYACAETLQRGAELGDCLSGVLARARLAGAIRPEVTADDLRRLISAVGRALESDAERAEKIDLYVAVLMQGLRPPRPGSP